MRNSTPFPDCKGTTSADFVVKTAPERSSWKGTVEHVYSEKVRTFQDVLEMTFLINQKLDETGFPQCALGNRNWEGYFQNEPESKNTLKGRGKMPRSENSQKLKKSRGGPTFFIRINYRQNASWQGTIQWLEGKKSQFFRSHLEMVMLMQEAMDKSGVAESSSVFSSWDDEEEEIS